MERSSISIFPASLPSLLVLVLLFMSNTSFAARAIVPKTNMEFIRSSCGASSYPRLCVSSLMEHASAIQTSPKLLADTALSVTIASARSTSATMVSMLARSRGAMKPREVAAMRDCVENMSDSVDELRKSLAEMDRSSSKNIGLQMNNIQTWVSAALTEEDTCMDGFAGNAMNGAVKTMVRNRIVNVAHLTSNALALINNLAAIQHTSP